MSPFDYVNQILQGKKNLIVDEVTEKEYSPFLTNRSLSYHMDCLMFANEMNSRHFIDKKMQNDFLLNTIRSFVEVQLQEQDDFLKVRETLTRIGVSSRKEKVLYQSCHILHKQGKYYIVHFKELFALDGKPSNITENDIQRRNAIANLLEEWGLVKILNRKVIEDNLAPIHQIKIISFKEKDDWELIPKYNIGKKEKD